MMGKTFDFPDDPKAVKAIAAVIKDISDQETKIAATKSYVKEAKKGLKDDHAVPLDVIAKMCALYHAQSANDYFEKQEDMELFYESLFPSTDNSE